MQRKISYLEQERGQKSPSVATMAYIFLSSRVKYCPFHSQYVICSFPYDRSMIRFKNVLWFMVEPDSFLSRICFALEQTRVSASRGTKSTLYRTRWSWKIIRVLGWNKATRITPPLTESTFQPSGNIEDRMNLQIFFREEESRATKLYLSDNFSRWRVMVHHYRIIALSRFYSFHLPREREFFSILIFRLARNNRIISSFVGSEFDSHRFDKVFESISLHGKNGWPFRKR